MSLIIIQQKLRQQRTPYAHRLFSGCSKFGIHFSSQGEQISFPGEPAQVITDQMEE